MDVLILTRSDNEDSRFLSDSLSLFVMVVLFSLINSNASSSALESGAGSFAEFKCFNLFIPIVCNLRFHVADGHGPA